MAPDPTPNGRLRAAEATMRLRAMAAGRTYTGRTDYAYLADERRARAENGECAEAVTQLFGGRNAILAGYGRQEAA